MTTWTLGPATTRTTSKPRARAAPSSRPPRAARGRRRRRGIGVGSAGIGPFLPWAGRRFITRTDTEVLCRLLEAEGAAAVPRLSGMFALAAWREEGRELLLARDPFGEKPLYYVRDGAFLAFASELHALRLLPGVA